jgi:glycosyltransferase involved in cell wall biosynthesis
VIRQRRPDILHVQNEFPLISPAIFYAAHHEGIPTVLSLRQYRLYCLNAYFFREGQVCEDCIKQPIPIAGIQHRCYRDSLAGSLVSAGRITLHRLLRTYQHQVDMFIALTDFAYKKFVSHGLPAHKVRVKPNFVAPTPTVAPQREHYVAYVGRLSPEKGINVLLQAWQIIGPQIPLKIAGSGPLEAVVQKAARENAGIQYLGQQSHGQITALLGQAQALIFPSLWYEGLPRVIIEAYATGTPVIASNLGAMATLVQPEKTGKHFSPGNVPELIEAVLDMLHRPQAWAAMQKAARREFENQYSAEANYRALLEIYHQAYRIHERSP